MTQRPRSRGGEQVVREAAVRIRARDFAHGSGDQVQEVRGEDRVRIGGAVMATDRQAHQVAMREYLRGQRARVETMYNRHRAVFAEYLVAAHLPGATVSRDPSAAWDVTWRPTRRPTDIRIQVKCSGEYLPRRPGLKAAARWDLKEPSKGYDETAREVLGAGHHCDVFVLARHTGEDIRVGWSFGVLGASQIAGYRRINEATLATLGAELVSGPRLSAEVRAASKLKA